MALVHCTKCGHHPVSTTAVKCPRCGAPRYGATDPSKPVAPVVTQVPQRTPSAARARSVSARPQSRGRVRQANPGKSLIGIVCTALMFAAIFIYADTETNSPSGLRFFWIIFGVYALVSGIVTLRLVRPPLIGWYSSSVWFIRGSGPVDILFRQIGMRISFEVFILVLSCIFGSLGGWILVLL